MRRLNYILKRILQMLPVLLVVTIITFLMIHLLPGDPARIMAGEKARRRGLSVPFVRQDLRALCVPRPAACC